MYEFLKKYVVNDVKEENNEIYIFYPVSESDITDAEKRMGFKFPNSLKQFYREIGYGFMAYGGNNINRIMHPDDIADYFCDDEVYDYVDKEYYEKDELVFFHISGQDFLTMVYDGKKEGEILCFHRKIADSFEDFISKMYAEPNYF